MDIKPIKTDSDYRSALAEAEQLFNAAKDTPEGDKLDVLATLIDAYEEKYFHIPLPDPIEAILHHMESRGLSQRDLEPQIGDPMVVAEILNRKRPLSIDMIQKLHESLGISADILIQPYALAQNAA